jgi:hypothetical protein
VTATTSTQINSPSTLVNFRAVSIYGGQLYASNDSTTGGNTISLGTVGTGLPTASATYANVNGLEGVATESRYAFFFADTDAGIAGLDTLYVADDSLGLKKYSLVSETWTLNSTTGSGTDAYRSVTGSVSGSTVTLFATRKGGSAAAGGGELVKIVDASGYNAAVTASPSVIATAVTGGSFNTSFRGLAMAPAAPVSIPILTIAATDAAAADLGADATMMLERPYYSILKV